MTRKKRQEASQRMKQIWAKRKAKVTAGTFTTGSGQGNTITVVGVSAYTDEVERMREIVRLMGELSAAGKQYLVNRFM